MSYFDVAKVNTFSIMKGIAIISVVIGHCAPFPFVESFVNQYHLAVFFFVAGYFFKEKYIGDIQFVVKKVKSLYVPYVISGIVFFLLHPILEYLYIYDVPLSIDKWHLVTFDLCVRLTTSDPLMGAMWFCSALLFVSIFSWTIFSLTRTVSPNMRTFVFIVVAMVSGGGKCLAPRNKIPILHLAVSFDFFDFLCRI